MNGTFFSVIIPSYNREKFIQRAIDSVLKQTYQNFEIIVADDGSTDGTKAVVKSIDDQRIRYLEGVHSERAVARNKGVSIAQGGYVSFLDSDDYLYPHHLESALKIIDANRKPEVVFIRGSELRSFDNCLLSRSLIKGDINEKIIKWFTPSANNVFIRKDIVSKYAFNEDIGLSGSEDMELWIRLASRFEFYPSDDVTSVCISHKERSTVHVSREQLITRMNLLVRYLREDGVFEGRYKKYERLFTSYTYTYIALHLALMKKYKDQVIYYIFKSLLQYPGVVFTKRFYTTIKHIF